MKIVINEVKKERKIVRLLFKVFVGSLNVNSPLELKRRLGNDYRLKSTPVLEEVGFSFIRELQRSHWASDGVLKPLPACLQGMPPVRAPTELDVA